MRVIHILLLSMSILYVSGIDVLISSPVKMMDCTTYSYEEVPVYPKATCTPSCDRGVCLSPNSCGCRPTMTKDFCQKQFHEAASGGEMSYIDSEVSRLISNGLNLNWPNIDNNGYTALDIASKNGYVDTLRMLIDAGADLEHADDWGVTALYRAAEDGQTAVLEVLVAHGANVNMVNAGGGSPLIAASESEEDHVDIVRMLINAGADVAYADKRHGRTALHYAARYNHADVARLLLQNGADKDKENRYGQTPADVSRDEGDGSVARLIDNY